MAGGGTNPMRSAAVLCGWAMATPSLAIFSCVPSGGRKAGRPGKRAYEPGVWCMKRPYLARLEGQLVLADVVGSQVDLGSVASQHGGNRRKRRRLNAGSSSWRFFYTVSTAQASRRGSTPCAAASRSLASKVFRELCRLRLLPRSSASSSPSSSPSSSVVRPLSGFRAKNDLF